MTVDEGSVLFIEIQRKRLNNGRDKGYCVCLREVSVKKVLNVIKVKLSSTLRRLSCRFFLVKELRVLQFIEQLVNLIKYLEEK